MRKYLLLIILPCLAMLTACGGSEDEIKELDNPEKITIAFFHALYNERDVQKAASVCSPKLARIILHYKSPRAVARHLFNMSFDQVEIKPDDTGVKVREQFKDQAVITVYFDGTYHGEVYKDVKRISLIQKDDTWVINKILKDPF
ncbi:hypothetical protein Q4489_14865 [Thalassotalea sp. 1_MG-2023]|uniref:hypothetical protein n=1 Tax=Thalassotalea sp. 1_MG-2023 TaxID=3062680 RepID=UPI0026E18AE2|nr:hypothetical protein [Thalassotalea sp. 1_MG-2023]MDO6428299.1 hypothetical protein [Thalassotalea sp. 1_MG-2023]